ncbi:MAG TPA: hypothetical protein DD401_00650 [Prevotella sp.]|nr:hypothetical protein [Prevotella sp.]
MITGAKIHKNQQTTNFLVKKVIFSLFYLQMLKSWLIFATEMFRMHIAKQFFFLRLVASCTNLF